MPKQSIKQAWRIAWSSDTQRQQILGGSFLLLVILALMPVFFGFIEKRKGILLHDWLLNLIPAQNVSGLIFAIIWGMALLTIYRALYKPDIFINYCWTLLFVSIARFITIWLVPLSPPLGLIPLHDPLTGIFYGEANITKDLFFSGHTSTICIMLLCLQNRTDKLIAFAALVCVMLLLLVQHIHYTLDVAAAPLFVYAINKLTMYLLHGKHQYKSLDIVYSKKGKYTV